MSEKLVDCVLCGEPVHCGSENPMPTTIGLCHSECFRDECGKDWFLVVEAMGKRIEQLEKRLSELDRRTFSLVPFGG